MPYSLVFVLCFAGLGLLSHPPKRIQIYADETRPVPESLALALLYGCQAHSQLDGGEACPFDPEAALEEAGALAKDGELDRFFEFFRNLEILTPRWRALLTQPVSGN